MKRKIIPLLIVLLIVIPVLSIVAFAHPGKTDSVGGHTDHSTGEYHYHHGYSAHDHYDFDDDGIVDCPYDFEDATSKNQGSQAEASSTNRYFESNEWQQEKDSMLTARSDGMKDYHEMMGSMETSDSISGDSSVKQALDYTIGVWIFLFILLSIICLLVVKFKKKNALISDLETQLKYQREGYAKLKSDLAKICYLAVKTAPKENMESIKQFCKTYGVEDLDIPDDVFFVDGFIPAKGCVDKEKPYGDFTVYVADSGTRFHTHRFCTCTTLRTMHIYETGYRFTPCSRCAKGLSNITPEWYKEIKRITNVGDKL